MFIEPGSRAAVPGASLTRWSAPIALPLVPAAAAVLPTGKVLLWSSNMTNNFTASGSTHTAIFDPVASSVSTRLESALGHNMFCPGTAFLPDGRLLVNGGYDSGKTSIYDPVASTWSAGAIMGLARGYNASTTMWDGSVLTLGGAWKGGAGAKRAEVYTPSGGWRSLTGIPDSTEFMINGQYAGWQSNGHYALIPTGNGRVLLAGPGPNMYWLDTRGSGAYSPAGPRGDDGAAFSGNTVMYDAGLVLKVGGSTWNSGGVAANASAYLIDTTRAVAQVTKLPSMAYARGHHTSVVLPNGQVVVIGGQTRMEEFSDAYAVLAPELFDPATGTFTVLPAMSVPRTYHSIALLLPDARVLAGGGGLCNCAADHANAEIMSPPYLFNADGTPATRPVIASAPTTAGYGTTMSVTTNSPVTSFAMVRLNATTHSVNNDQRRVSLAFTALDATRYQVAVPSNPGIAVPGPWMLFAMTAAGTPSVAKIVNINGTGAPVVMNPGNATATVGTAMTLPIAVSTPAGTLVMSATGLPPGLAINASTGTISGTPTQAGSFVVTVSAANGSQRVSTDLLVTVANPTTFTLVSSPSFGFPANGTPFVDPVVGGQTLTGIVVRHGAWLDAIQGLATPSNLPVHGGTGGTAATISWPASDGLVRIHGAYSNGYVSRISFVTREGRTFGPYGTNGAGGTISTFDYTVPAGATVLGFVGSSDAYLRSIGLRYGTLVTYRTPTIQAITAPPGSVGTAASLSVVASDPDGHPLTYRATNLPPGLSINASTGAIGGTFSTTGTYAVTVTATNGGNLSASTSFNWSVLAAFPRVTSLPAPIVTSGTRAFYTPVLSEGAAAWYRWNFGDGSPDETSTTSAASSHVFAAAGVYGVTLTLGAADGRTSTHSFLQAVTAAGVPLSTAARSSSNVALVPVAGSGARLWVVNQDQDTVTVFDTASNGRLAEVPVGVSPRAVARAADGRVWIVNKGSASISVVSPSTLAVTQTIALPRGSQPFGLVFSPADGSAFVALEGAGAVLKLHGSTGAVLASRFVGETPRHLAIDASGALLLVPRYVTRALPGESTATVVVTGPDGDLGGEVLGVSAGTLEISGSVVLAYSHQPDGSNSGSGVPNYLAAPAFAPDGRSAWVPSKQDNVTRGMLRNGADLTFKHTVRAITSRIDLVGGREDTDGRIDHNLSSLASAAAFHPSGAYLFVALEGNRQVVVVDPVGRRELFRVPVGLAPDGLTVSTDGLRLYVNNFLGRTVTSLDLTPLVHAGLVPTSGVTLSSVVNERLTATVLRGKQLFYDAADPRLTRDSYMSCATCHNDGGQDGRVWDLTGLGEGLRNTISLRGRGGVAHGFAHWSANFDEVQDFEAQIRGLAAGTGLMTDAQFNTGTRSLPLGDRKAGVSADLDALAAYVTSLSTFERSPYRNSDGTLTAAAVAGKQVFATRGCGACHGGPGFTRSAGASALVDVGTIRPSSGSRLGATLSGLDIPTLRDAWATAPYLHDGSAATLAEAVTRHNGVSLSAADLGNLVAYLQQIDGDEPAPGGIAVSLAGRTTVTGIVTVGAAVPNGGLDGNGRAYAAALVGRSLNALGATFALAPPDAANAATSTTIDLPNGSFQTLSLLGTGVNGRQDNQDFTVTYTDGSTSRFRRSLSSWVSPQGYSGETAVLTMSYRAVSGGSQTRTVRLYGYQLALNPAKRVRSVTLPPNRNVVVLAATLH